MSQSAGEPKFKKSELNPLTQLSQLRMAIAPDDDGYGVACQMRFSTGDVSFSGRENTVGITEARLQLALEGCETALGCDFGNVDLQVVDEEEMATSEANYSGDIKAGVSCDGIELPSASVRAKGEKQHRKVRRSNKTLLPMTAVPTDAWKVKVVSANTKENLVLDGAAIDGQRLCKLQRKEGGNRMHLSAELQVRRSSISVVPRKGDIVGKLFSVKRNKDAVIAKVLERAIRREASSIRHSQTESTVVASKAELTEE